jgi:signal transduction histidine kinase
VAFTAYAIYRQRLFNLNPQNVVYGILAFIACSTTAAGFIFVDNISYEIITAAGFISVLLVSIEFIRNLFKLESINLRLKSVNSVLSHDVKAMLGKNGQMFLEISLGTFGEPNEMLTKMSKQLYKDNNELLKSILNILANPDQKPVPQPFDLKAAVVKAVKNTNQDLAEKRGLKIETIIDETGDYTINADPARISEHILQNLVDNAVNYTLHGNIEVKLSKKDPSTFLFSVKDSGVGISAKDQKVIFTEGGHGENSIKTNVHSSGYGLHIAKSDVEAHKGKIWFDSIEGQGTTFFVELPVDFTHPGASEVHQKEVRS